MPGMMLTIGEWDRVMWFLHGDGEMPHLTLREWWVAYRVWEEGV